MDDYSYKITSTCTQFKHKIRHPSSLSSSHSPWFSTPTGLGFAERCSTWLCLGDPGDDDVNVAKDDADDKDVELLC